MQTYDVVMLVVMAGAIAFGFWKGLAWQVASTGSLVVSYFVALNFREPVSQLFSAEPPWNKFLAMLVLFVGSWIGVWIGFHFVKKSLNELKLKDFDRQAGALLGAAKGALLCILITFFAVTLLGEKQTDAICRSHSGYYISVALDHADALMPQELHAHLDPYLNRLEEELDPAREKRSPDELDLLEQRVKDLLEDDATEGFDRLDGGSPAPSSFDGWGLATEAARRAEPERKSGSLFSGQSDEGRGDERRFGEREDGRLIDPDQAARALFRAAEETFRSTR